MSEFLFYYRRVFTRASRETFGFLRRKLLAGAFMAVIVRCAFWSFTQHMVTWNGVWHEIRQDSLIIVASYAMVSLGAFLLNLIHAPVLLDTECQKKITHLSDQLAFPDKVLADHLSNLLSQIGENGQRLLRWILMYDEVVSSVLRIPDLSAKDLQESIQQCLSLGLLKWWNDAPDPSSSARWYWDHYSVPVEFRESLKRLLYRAEEPLKAS